MEPKLGACRRSETVPALFSLTDSELVVEDVIICAVLAVLSAVPIPRSHSESRTPRCGCADHHVIELTALA